MKRLAAWALFLVGGPGPAAQEPAPADFKKDIRPLLETYCFKCHGPGKPKGELDLTAFADEKSVLSRRKVWEEVARRVRDGEMPPEDKAQPKAAEKARLLAWFDAAAARHDASAPRDPGRPALRRLNKTEYNNSVRDLLGVDLKPGDDFPTDDSAHGFDTIGEALAIPPLLVEKYFAAAERILDQLLLPEPADRKFEGKSAADVEFPAGGRYAIRARASGEKLEIRVDGKRIREFTLEEGKPVEVIALIGSGRKRVEAVGAKVEAIEVAGPLSAPGAKEARKRLFFVEPSKDVPRREAARRIVERFAGRAYRRPLAGGEMERLLGLFDRGDTRGDPFETSVRRPIQAVLCSPHFLMRVEEDRASAAPWAVSDHELATRLSYFLWSSMPDERLFGLAGERKLHDSAVLEGEVRRMLADKKSQALIESFLHQWLTLDAFRFANPDQRVFPEFHKDWHIRRTMGEEIRMFVEGIVREDRSLIEFLDADYTFLDEALARWYGVEGVKGEQIRKVKLEDRRRGGLLTMGAVLVMTSSPDRTSVVKRGKWVLEKIFGVTPPPPPADAGELKKEEKKEAARTLRERMASHRSDPRCSSCHVRIDPLGFGLETFDGAGRWRDQEAGKPVDATGVLPGGKSFSGPVELKDLLLARKDEFVKALAEKMLVYALGRGLGDGDVATLREVVESAKKGDYRFSALAIAVAKSHAFRHRRRAEGDAR